MTRALRSLVLAALLGGACAGGPPGPRPEDEPCRSVLPEEVKTEEERVMYAAGYLLGKTLVPLSPSPSELALVQKGLRDAVKGAPPALPPAVIESYRPRVRETAQARKGVAALRERERGVDILDSAAAEPGAKRLPSGLVVHTLRPGSTPPGPAARVQVRSQRALGNGAAVDVAPREEELALASAPPCLREGLQHVGVGGQARLYCPAALLHGEAGAPPLIPGGAVVVYTLELLRVLP